MDKLTPHMKLMSLLAEAQRNDQLHARLAQDHSERHEQLQEKKRVERATAARTVTDGNTSR